MIQEAYVSFEVAKLLKEKGFNEPCRWAYDPNSSSFAKNFSEPRNSELNDYEYSKPTHQVAMAWFRETHNISIELFIDWGSDDEFWWTADIGKIRKNGLIAKLSGFESYEDAVEAALRYCLEII